MVGEQACLRGSIVLKWEEGDCFEFSGDDIYNLSLLTDCHSYKYVSIDKKNGMAIVEYDTATPDLKKMYRKTMGVPLTACLDAKEILRWGDDYRKYRAERENAQEQAHEQERASRRGFFKRR